LQARDLLRERRCEGGQSGEAGVVVGKRVRRQLENEMASSGKPAQRGNRGGIGRGRIERPGHAQADGAELCHTRPGSLGEAVDPRADEEGGLPEQAARRRRRHQVCHMRAL
jgi:hypothetical protein